MSAIVINGKGIIVTPQDINRISKISELPFLCNVHMSNMTMTDSLIEALRNYKKLNSLALDNVVITDHQLRQLGKISSLINFRLENSTNISEQAFIEFLEANPQLIGIDSKNAIPMTDQIALTISRLPKLEIISLGERSLTDRHIEIMSNSRFVKIILLSDCSHISDDSLQYFKRMPSLSWLNLYGTSVTSSGVAGFKSAKPACAVDGDVK
ncbi:MAG: hypothetical protein LBJ00_02235 [Planctomycetaceae bacterium]|nr:hypothetical protein [Planctomycetaceae bacterium]